MHKVNYTISGVIIKDMEFIRKIKGSLLRGLKKLSKHEVCILVILFVVSISFMCAFSREVDHHAKMLESEKEKFSLILQIQNMQFDAKETGDAFDFQTDIILNQQQLLEKAEEVMNIQKAALQELIRYLKDIKHWPPRIKPIDPDTLANST